MFRFDLGYRFDVCEYLLILVDCVLLFDNQLVLLVVVVIVVVVVVKVFD